jgi:hypothetical protein
MHHTERSDSTLPKFTPLTEKDRTLSTRPETSVVGQLLEELKREVARYMPAADIHATPAVRRLVTYRDAIAPNFVPWMTHVWVRCKSDFAREACQDNLLCEVKEDHPQMLRDYVAQVERQFVREQLEQWPVPSWLSAAVPHINFITALTQRSAIDGLLVMAALENTSLVFIPRMKAWGESLRFADFTYVDKHGVADIAHADEFRKAVEAEAAAQNVALSSLAQSPALGTVNDLLYSIFG